MGLSRAPFGLGRRGGGGGGEQAGLFLTSVLSKAASEGDLQSLEGSSHWRAKQRQLPTSTLTEHADQGSHLTIHEELLPS